MAIYRGPGGPGDATNDATSQAILAAASAVAAANSEAAAASSAVSAATSATNAATSATNAASSASAAATSESAVDADRIAAEAAKVAAEAAQTAAETAETNAETAATSAASSASSASTSATAAASSASAASTSATSAATSATNASNSATAAASSASDAADSATEAAGYAASINPANFATASQGAKADTALQPASIGVSVQGYDTDLAAIAASNAGAQIASYGQYGVGFKNRIINGAMMIDQRNAGASVTPTNGSYTIDRWQAYSAQASKYSVQQNAGAVTPPVGFKNYLGVTSLSAYSVTSTDYFFMAQKIEGFNVSDLAWGTANAKAVTVSFQVYSSLTGSFGAMVGNGAQDRSYPFSYTVSAANTWTNVSVTIPGDTSGTWATDNSTGLYLYFTLGSGSTRQGTANTWAGAWYIAPTGSVNVVGTNGATFYITGVQLEKGSTATSFDYRPYGTELALCQRYYIKYGDGGGVAGGRLLAVNGTASSTVEIDSFFTFPVAMRTQPSGAFANTRLEDGGGGAITPSTFNVYRVDNINDSKILWAYWGGVSGATAYRPYFAMSTNSGAYIALSAEL